MQILAAITGKPQYMFQYANPNRTLGEQCLISGDPSQAIQTPIVSATNGQPTFGQDDFFNGDSA